jgi:hypothetical protein
MSEHDLQRDAKRRGLLVAAIAGLALIALGVALFFLGMNFEEPADRLATRSVPAIAPIALSVTGVIVALGGVVMIVRGLRSRV